MFMRHQTREYRSGNRERPDIGRKRLFIQYALLRDFIDVGRR
jgi:hypothetical protein